MVICTPRSAGTIQEYLSQYTFPPVKRILAAKDGLTAFKAYGNQLPISRGAYIVLVRALQENAAEKFREQVLSKFASCGVAFMTGRKYAYKVENQKIKFVIFE